MTKRDMKGRICLIYTGDPMESKKQKNLVLIGISRKGERGFKTLIRSSQIDDKSKHKILSSATKRCSQAIEIIKAK